jgi:cytosine/adenosine deaminase-related metal-dependent hydrolase
MTAGHADLLVTGGTILTMDDANRVVEDGAVAIVGERIAAVGSSAEVSARFSGTRTIDARRHAVMPGLIDTHGHAGHAIARQIGSHTRPYGWRAMVDHLYFRSATEDFWHADGLVSALERLKFGTTTGMAMLGSAPRTDRPEFAQAYARGYGEVGNRVIVGVGPPRPPWPKTFSYWDGMTKTDRQVTYDEVIEVSDELIARDNGSWDGRVSMWASASRFLTPSRLDPMFDESQLPFARRQAEDLRRLADTHKTGIHTHSYGGAIQYVSDHYPDLLGPDVVLAHCTGLSPSEVEILARTNTRVSHCPSSGRYTDDHSPCPVPALLDAGAVVAIASDGTNSQTFDLFKDVRQAMYIQRYEQQNRWVLPPGKALKMVTIEAARAIGREEDLGSIEVGKRADIILLDLWKPHLQPINVLTDQIAHKAMGSDVDTVICDGKVIMEGRRATLVDEDQVLDFAVQEGKLLRERGGLEPLYGHAEGYWDCSRY